MNAAFHSSLANQLGWTLFHSVWQFTGIAVALWLVLKALQIRGPKTRYWAQCCCLLSMVAVSCITFCTLATDSTTSNRVVMQTSVAANSRMPDSPSIDSTAEPVSRTQNAAEVVVAEATSGLVSQSDVGELPAATVTASSSESLSDKLSRWRDAMLSAVAPWLSTMILVWLIGVAVLSVRPLIGWRSVRRLRKVGIGDASESAIEIVRRVSRQLGVSQAIKVVESALIEVPTVVGWLRPLILLPASALTGLSTEHLEAVIAHELAHIRRYDYLVNAVQVVLETIFFYHPAIWWVSRSMRDERERCCDEIAVALTGDRTEYVKLLLRLEETRGTSAIAHPALSAGGGNLMDRIKGLTDPHTGRTSSGGVYSILLLAAVVVGCGLWLIGNRNELGQQATAAEETTRAAAVPQQRRLFSFPDAPPKSNDWKATRRFTDARDSMERATWDSEAFNPEAQRQIRESLERLIAEFGDDSLGTYAARRLVILDWQTGEITSAVASDRLKQLVDGKDDASNNFTRAMALTIDARAFDFDTFRQSFASLKPARTPQLGWFVSEWARYFVQEYPHRNVTAAVRMRGQPIAEEHRRSIAVADWLESQLFDALDASLQHTEQEYAKHSDDWQPDPAKDGLEAAQMVNAVEQIADATHKILARRLYLDISTRATSTLLPRTLALWERAVRLLEASQSTLESPDRHSQKIQNFREQIIPQLKRMQNHSIRSPLDIPPAFRNAIAGDSTFGHDSTKHVGQRQSIADWQSALRGENLTREQQIFAWWRIGSLAAYNFDVARGETPDLALAAKAFEQVHSISGDLISQETLNAATVYGGLAGVPIERARRMAAAYRWLFTRTDAMIAKSVAQINHNAHCIDDALMPGGMRLDTAAKKHKFLTQELNRSREVFTRRMTDEIRYSQNPAAIQSLLNSIGDLADKTQLQQWTALAPKGVASASRVEADQEQAKDRSGDAPQGKAGDDKASVEKQTGEPSQESTTDDSTKSGRTIKNVAERLLKAAGTPTWQLASVDEQPTVDIDGFRGYRLTLRRTWKHYTSPPQQRAEPREDRGPFELRHEDWQFVLVPTDPQPAPAELKSKIPWEKSLSPYHTRDVCLGEGLGFVWFTHGTLYGQELVRERLNLQGGDDRIALLIDGMQVEDTGTATANSCRHAIARFGDAALPAIQKSIEAAKVRDSSSKIVRSLASIQTDRATQLLLRLYQSEEDPIRDAAAYALIHEPFRATAKDAYFDMLRRHEYVYEVCRACVKFAWKDAVPVLNDLVAHSANLRELSVTIPARRELMGNPTPQELLAAKKEIIAAGYNADREIDQPRKLLIESNDSEATLLIAIELATFTSKGSSARTNEIGIEILKSRPRQVTVDDLKGLIDGMPPEPRRQAEKLLHSVTHPSP